MTDVIRGQKTLDAIIRQRRMTRRDFLRASGAVGFGAAAFSLTGCAPMAKEKALYEGSLTFREIAKGDLIKPLVPEGYLLDVLVRWGDALDAQVPFDPTALTARDQETRFGYNNDYLAFMPMQWGSDNSQHGLLCVNHEYTNLRLMFPGMTLDEEMDKVTEEQTRIEQASLGCSVVEIRKETTGWQVVSGSIYSRRLHANTPMKISGPAAGDKRMQTAEDALGILAKGTFANCAGGVTPWGTVLTAEENIHTFFTEYEAKGKKDPEARNHKRMGIGMERYYRWEVVDERFDSNAHPHEPNRFGWIVEYDPYRPEKPPVKRTALGRFKHECANTTLTPDGRVAIYSGDDEMFEYVYRFITKGKYNPNDREANDGLLDEGTLYVAKFNASGMVEWLPLVYGQGPLTKKNGFHSQADVLIETRYAAELMGATPMDRPEDVEVNARTGQLFIALTKNTKRAEGEENEANRRGPNPYGHILELSPPLKGDMPDHSADMFFWNVFLEGGDPINPTHHAYYQHYVSQHGWLTNPDNLAFDKQGRIWIATDGQPDAIGMCDGLYAADTEGKGKGSTRLFFNAPRGAEVTGPAFTPDCTTLFISVQHPGDFPLKSTYDAPSTRWPDFRDDMPPRPAVVAITKEDGKVIGS